MSFDYDNQRYGKSLERIDKELREHSSIVNDLQTQSSTIDRNTGTIPAIGGGAGGDDTSLLPQLTEDTHTTTEDGEVLDLTGSSYEDITLQITQTGAGAATVDCLVSQDGVTYTTLFTLDTSSDTDNIQHRRRYNCNYLKYEVTALTANNVKCSLGAYV